MNKNNCDCSNHYPKMPQNTALRAGDPSCGVWAVIPSFSVPTQDNLKGLRDCFVHVEDINTTYYINNLHQPIITWAGPIFVDDYDYDVNPLKVRNNVVYDNANHRIITYDAKGGYAIWSMDGDNL